MAKKYSRKEIEQHAKALGMSDVGDLSELSKKEYKNFTNELNTFKAEEKHKTESAKQESKVFRATSEGKNYIAKAKAAKAAASDADKASGDISIADLPAATIRRINKEIPVTTTTTAAGDDAHKDIKISKARYDKGPDVVVGGRNVFHGTNIPTTGFSPEVIARYNATLKADIDNKDWYGANDTLFSIAYAQGGGAGNPRVGALQAGMWRVTADPKATLWAEQNLNSANDQYILRDDKGVPTGVVLGYDENLGIIRGTPKKGQETTWKSIGSWGENARAGIVEGRPTNAPQAGLTTTSIYNPDRPGYDQFTGNLIDYAGPPGGSGIGTAVGGLMATTPYTQPAPQDWSGIRPGVFGQPSSELAVATGLPAQQAIFGPQGRAMQPWATGQQVPAGLVNYQIPGGAPVDVGYSNPNLGLFDFNKGATTSGDTTTTAATSGNFMGQPYSNTAQYHNLLSLNNKAMQLIRGGHAGNRGIGDLMGDPNWVNTQYAQLGGTDPIVGGGSFGNYIAPPGETAPFYTGPAVRAQPTQFQPRGVVDFGAQDYDAPINPIHGILGYDE